MDAFTPVHANLLAAAKTEARRRAEACAAERGLTLAAEAAKNAKTEDERVAEFLPRTLLDELCQAEGWEPYSYGFSPLPTGTVWCPAGTRQNPQDGVQTALFQTALGFGTSVKALGPRGRAIIAVMQTACSDNGQLIRWQS